MPTPLERALFEEEWSAVRQLPEAERWELERDSTVALGLFVIMHPKKAPAERFKARLRWTTDYFGPFSLKFVNLLTGADCDHKAWPQCFGFRPGSLDACLPWTSEGHALHPEWKTSGRQAFPVVQAPMQHALLRVQHALDSSYAGRG
jgi:hypothetical protein